MYLVNDNTAEYLREPEKSAGAVDAEILDSYSQAVTAAVERISSAVAQRFAVPRVVIFIGLLGVAACFYAFTTPIPRVNCVTSAGKSRKGRIFTVRLWTSS